MIMSDGDLRHDVAIIVGQVSRGALRTKQTQANAQFILDAVNNYDSLRQQNRVLMEVAEWLLAKTSLSNRWPCPDCGRADQSAPLRTIEYTQEGGCRVISGCWLCNTEEVRDAARAALKMAKEQE